MLKHSLGQLKTNVLSVIRVRCLILLELLDQLLDLVWILGFDGPELRSILTNKSITQIYNLLSLSMERL